MQMMRHASLQTTTKYLRGVKERMKEAAKGIGQQWVMMLDQDSQIPGANFRGQLGANLGSSIPLISSPENVNMLEPDELSDYDDREIFSGGGQTRTVDSADMSRVL